MAAASPGCSGAVPVPSYQRCSDAATLPGKSAAAEDKDAYVVTRKTADDFETMFLEQSLDHGSCDVAGRNCVYADAVAAPFGSEVAAELEDGGFGGVVGWADEALVESVRELL